LARRNDGSPGKSAWRFLRNVIRPNVRVTPLPRGILVDWDVPVTVRDGTKLRVNVFRPQTSSQPVPVLMSAHPYGKDKIPAKTRGVPMNYRLVLQPRAVCFSEMTSWEAPDPAVWVPRGYAVVNADLRGAGTSDGIGDLFTEAEAVDYYDLIEWAGTQAWSNGRVALDGVSYLAISQYRVATLHPPHLAAICPWEGFTDIYRDFMRPGGVRENGFSVIWGDSSTRIMRVQTDLRKEFNSRPERDAWFESITPELERIHVPMLVCGSFSDHALHSRGAMEAFRRVSSKHKWLYTHRDGKWCHYYDPEATETRGRFFDRFLKGIDNGWERQPSVRLAIYDIGSQPAKIVGVDSWPPSGLQWSTLALDASSGTLTSAPPQQAASISFDMRRGEAVFSWILPEDMDILGPMALRVHIEVRRAEDVYLFAGVRKIRNNVEVLYEGTFGFPLDMVTKGWQRAGHRELDRQLSTPAQPVHTHRRVEPLRKGEVVPVDIALIPHATCFRKGDVLRLELRGRWHYSRNPFTGTFPFGYERSPKGTCVIHAGGVYDSGLLFGHCPDAEALGTPYTRFTEPKIRK
jgi:predicted acyl esterase